MDSEIDYDKIVRLTNWKLQLDAQPDMSTRADFEREWGALNETERFLCKIAKSIVLEREHRLQTTSSERAERVALLAEHLGADVKRRVMVSEGHIEIIIFPRTGLTPSKRTAANGSG